MFWRFIVIEDMGKKDFHRYFAYIFYRLRYTGKRGVNIIHVGVVIESDQ